MGVLWKGTASSLMGLFDKRSGEGRCWRQGSGSWPGPVNGPGFLWGEVLREKTWLTCACVRARGSGKAWGFLYLHTPAAQGSHEYWGQLRGCWIPGTLSPPQGLCVL